MKKAIFIFSLSLIVSSASFCQSWVVSQVIKGSLIEPKYSVIDDNNNIYILSFFSDTIYNPYNTKSRGQRDLFLTKINSVGTTLWYKHIGGIASDVSGGLVLDNQNHIFVTGTFYGNCRFTPNDSLINKTNNGDIFLARYNTDGTFNWAKKISSASTYESSLDIKFSQNQDLIICGAFKDSLIIGSTISDKDTLVSNGYMSNYITNFDLDGNRIWTKQTLGNNNITRFMRISIGDNGYYIGGFFQGSLFFDVGTITSYSANYDAFIYKVDFNGVGQWVRKIRGQNIENFKSLSTDEYDNVYVLGNYNSPSIYVDSTSSIVKTISGNIGFDTYIAKYNRSGVLQWFLRKGSTAKDIYSDFVVKNNVIYATGYFGNQIVFNNDTLKTIKSNISDIFLAAFNEIGDPISGISIKGNDTENLINLVNSGTIVNMDANSRAYVAGYFKTRQIQIGTQIYNSNNYNKSDLFFAIYKQRFKAVITDEDMVSCNGLSDGMLTVTPYFGTPPYTYSWSHNPSLNSDIAENLAAGDYTVTVRDANDSITSITGHVSQAPVLDITGIVTPVSCFNGNDGGINITPVGGSGVYNYLWTSVIGSGIQPLTEDQTGLSKGLYSVRVFDQNGCKDSTAFTVTEPQKFSYAGTVTTKIIIPPGNNGSINLNPAGGNYPYTFAWTGPNGYVAFTEDIGNLGDAGLYNLEITDAKNCKSDTTFTVIDNFTFVAEISAKTDVTCFGANDGTATVRVLNGTSPYSYQWSDGVTINDSVRTGLQPGLYVVTVTDGALKTSQASIRIYQPSLALSIVLEGNDLRCYNDNSGVIQLTVSGGVLPYSYSWNNGYTGEDLVNVSAGIYTVTVTDAGGCQVQGNKEINQPERIGLTIDIQDEILCHNGKTNAVANATGGTPPGCFDYLWDDPGNQVTKTAYQLKAGTYHCMVTDSNDCSIQTSVTINQPDTLSVDAVIVDPSCAGVEDGSIVPTAHGGTGTGYEYIWSNGVFQRFNTDIGAGTYVLTLNDANNCSISDTFDLADPDSVRITIIEVSDISCLGKTDGSAAIGATGGSGIFEYSDDNGATFGNDSLITGLNAGEYTFIVRDENECLSESELISITVSDTVTIDSIRVVDATCSGLDNGSVALVAGGGTGPYEYSDDGGLTFESESAFAGLAAGDYSMMVRDNNDCRSEQQPVTITYTDTIRIQDVIFTDLTCSGLPDGTITIKASGGTGVFTYSTDGGSSFAVDSAFVSLQQGDYEVVVKDGNNCLSELENITLHASEVCAMIIYDAFSPNHDGKNDVWNIANVGSFPGIVVKIYNIWGKEVFQSKGYGTPWDGSWDGKELPSGTYYYVIDPGDGSDVITGDVSIVK